MTDDVKAALLLARRRIVAFSNDAELIDEDREAIDAIDVALKGAEMAAGVPTPHERLTEKEKEKS